VWRRHPARVPKSRASAAPSIPQPTSPESGPVSVSVTRHSTLDTRHLTNHDRKTPGIAGRGLGTGPAG
jgi:hypothetical protein